LNVTDIAKLARDAKAAGRLVAKAGAERRTAALVAIADAVDRQVHAILEANLEDVNAATKAGLAAPMVDRLRLDESRVGKIVTAIREVAALPDPVGNTIKK